MALVEHLKRMALTSGAKIELKSLLSTLLKFGIEETVRKVQYIGENFQFSQMAAVKLAEDSMSTEIVDDQAYSLDRYLKKLEVASSFTNLDCMCRNIKPCNSCHG